MHVCHLKCVGRMLIVNRSVLHTSSVLRTFVSEYDLFVQHKNDCVTCSTCEFVNRTVQILTTLLIIFGFVKSYMLVPVSARSKVLVCGSSLGKTVGSNSAGARTPVCCECCVLSCTDLCEELITRSEASYRLWCVVCDLETS
jgi:hypothetical protein